MYNNDMKLSLNGDAFSILKEQFDKVLARTVGNMQMKRADDATITLKLSINLEKENRSTPEGDVEAVIPKFKHDISSVMQVKDKVSGELVGDYQLVWDEAEQKYIMRKIDNGQTTLFDDEPYGKFVDADYRPVDELPGGENGALALPEPSESAEDAGKGNDTPEAEGREHEDAEGFGEVLEGSGSDGDLHSDDRYDETTPFGWLAQFVGEAMHVTEAMGNYTVRTEANKVVLSSATDPSSPFYCDSVKLAEHVGHDLICVGYGDEELDVISIRCLDCKEGLFMLIAPDATDKDVNKALNGDTEDKSTDADRADSEDYEYDPPEE